MDRSFDAVVHFQIKLGKNVFLVGRGFLDISQGTSIDNVADNETLDSLVLRDGLVGRHAAYTLDVSSAVLVASVIASFDSHVDQ